MGITRGGGLSDAQLTDGMTHSYVAAPSHSLERLEPVHRVSAHSDFCMFGMMNGRARGTLHLSPFRPRLTPLGASAEPRRRRSEVRRTTHSHSKTERRHTHHARHTHHPIHTRSMPVADTPASQSRHTCSSVRIQQTHTHSHTVTHTPARHHRQPLETKPNASSRHRCRAGTRGSRRIPGRRDGASMLRLLLSLCSTLAVGCVGARWKLLT